MHFSRFLNVASGVILAVAPLAAQGRGGTTTGSGTTSGGNPTNTGGLNNPTTNPNLPSSRTDPFPNGGSTRGIMISGKVSASDGTQVPPGILIERVCGDGRPHPEGHTDTKGNFSFTLGQEIGVFADASEAASTRNGMGNSASSRGLSERDLTSCELRAVFPGFRSDVVSLANHRYMDNPDVGVIILHRMQNVEGLTISVTSAMAPKDARKAFEKALEAEKKDKTDDAQKDLEKAVEVYPKYASAWFELGMVYERRDHFDKAREAYNNAVLADSKYINPYERLYMLDFKEAKWQEVADTTEKIVHLNPYNFPDAFYYNAVANLQLKKLEPAEKSAREAVKLDTKIQNPKTNYVLGVILAQKQEFTEAAECMRAYLKNAPGANDSDRVKKQIAEIEQMAQAKAQQKN